MSRPRPFPARVRPGPPCDGYRPAAEMVERSFLRGTAVYMPKGGLVFWVELPDHVDSTVLYARARDAGIAITPGTIFTLEDRLKNAIRLSCARWNREVQRRLEHLGSLV